MLSRRRLIWSVFGLTVGALWLAGCCQSPTSQVAVIPKPGFIHPCRTMAGQARGGGSGVEWEDCARKTCFILLPVY